MKKTVKYGIGMLGVFISAIIAILVHALLPSPGATMNTEGFDGYLVQLFGFPVVASMYFIVLYIHIVGVVFVFGQKSLSKKMQIGFCYGSSFGLMYLIGMQEVMVEGSPFDVYGMDFIGYQFFMGLGDAIPAFVLCMILALCMETKTGRKATKVVIAFPKKKLLRIIVIAACFFAERTIGYYIGYIDSDIHQYPIPTLVWTLIMGITFGIMNFLLEIIHPKTSKGRKHIQINVLSIGINWIWFNCFIGLIFKGTLVQMILKGGIDVLAIFIGCILAEAGISKLRAHWQN